MHPPDRESIMTPPLDRLPTFADIRDAARRIAPYATRTPLVEWAALNERVGARVLVKPETLQRTGSFKFRGAYNRIAQLDPAACPGGVVAYSSGNHAQGVAAAAALAGLPAVIVMPEDTPRMKRDNTQGYGAEVVTYDRASEDREEIARAIAEEKGAVIVPPYDDPDIVAGQGTVGLEMAEDAAARGVTLDHVVSNASGGGLIAGISLAFAELSPATRVWVAEPQGFDDHARSLASGRRETNEAATGSICDALLARTPGEITFAINSRRLAGGLVASDDEVRAAMAYAFSTLKLVVEPGGAVGLAALLSGRLEIEPGATVGVVLSGGNVDRESFCAMIG